MPTPQPGLATFSPQAPRIQCCVAAAPWGSPWVGYDQPL